MAAIGDEAVVETFADIARQEYLAVGLRVALHPQIDLATEPRWARQVNTFGEDAELSGRLGAAYVRGFQGSELGPQSVATMVKHFPGGGPQLDGEDPHFAYGREQVYPGGQFELHLVPFEAVFAAGPSQMMPYYGMPMGTEYEEVGFGFNRDVITGLLRERYGFDGIVCTDWGLLTDHTIMGDDFPARAWGVEHLTPRERIVKALEAGVDQFGGEAVPELLVELVESGVVSEERLDVSARRLLREKFRLGLFDQRYVDAEQATDVVGAAAFREAGEAAQRAAITILTNGDDAAGPTLPMRRGSRLYVEGIDPVIAADYGELVEDPAEADVAIVRLKAPYEQRATDVRELLPRRLARLRSGRGHPSRRACRAHILGRRRLPGSAGDPHLDPSAGVRRDRELRSQFAGPAGCAVRSRRAAGPAAVRPAVQHGGRGGQPARRPVRHRRAAVPVRPRTGLREGRPGGRAARARRVGVQRRAVLPPCLKHRIDDPPAVHRGVAANRE